MNGQAVGTKGQRVVEPARGGPLVAFDLDRTLLYSGAALGLAGPDARMPRLVVAEMHNGVPASYLTRAADLMLQELRTLATVVPTTTRTLAQYRRVCLGDTVP